MSAAEFAAGFNAASLADRLQSSAFPRRSHSFSSHSTSTGPFSLPASASPVSPVSLPSFVFLPCSQTDFSSRNPSSNPSNFALQDPLLRIKEENPAASQAGIDLRSLPEGTKKLLNAWIGKKSAEWTATSASIVQFSANLLESIPFAGVSSVDRSKVVPCFSFSSKTRFVFPAFLSTLLVSPSFTMQQLDELDDFNEFNECNGFDEFDEFEWIECGASCLKMNTENLQALKAHLESVKLKEKELKQKKHKRKV